MLVGLLLTIAQVVALPVPVWARAAVPVGVIAPAFFAGLYTPAPALPFAVLGAVNALSIVALVRLEHALPQRSLVAG